MEDQIHERIQKHSIKDSKEETCPTIYHNLIIIVMKTG
jgi:hypothetical protein